MKGRCESLTLEGDVKSALASPWIMVRKRENEDSEERVEVRIGVTLFTSSQIESTVKTRAKL